MNPKPHADYVVCYWCWIGWHARCALDCCVCRITHNDGTEGA